jgi:hypothetical protein
MGDGSERLSRIATVFENALKQARASEVKLDEEIAVDAHVDHVRIMAGGHSRALFNVNADGSVRGPVLGFHDETALGSINDDGVESNVAFAIKNELLDQMKWRAKEPTADRPSTLISGAGFS